MNYKKILIYIVVGACLFVAGWFSKPAKVETKTVVKTVEVEVEKKKENIDTETHIIERPDGTKETKIVSKVRTETKTSTKSKTDVSKSKVVENHSQWSVGLYVGYNPSVNKKSLAGFINRRVLGNISVGLYGRIDERLDTEVGLGLGMSF